MPARSRGSGSPLCNCFKLWRPASVCLQKALGFTVEGIGGQRRGMPGWFIQGCALLMLLDGGRRNLRSGVSGNRCPGVLARTFLLPPKPAQRSSQSGDHHRTISGTADFEPEASQARQHPKPPLNLDQTSRE